MRVLTFGWDYPPLKNGGLGVACFGLSEELIESGVEVVFVLPRKQPTIGRNRFLFPRDTHVTIREVASPLLPYAHAHSHFEFFTDTGERVRLSRKIIDEVFRYAEAARKIAAEEHFDIIHAHDWTSYLAGLVARAVSGKPLVLHVHATSFDQAASEYVDPDVYAIEKYAFDAAESVITVSNYTKNIVVNKFGIQPEKVHVVHNGVTLGDEIPLEPALRELKAAGKKIVLYHGRITIQKGVDYFVRAARKVVDAEPRAVFIISGWGDMERQIMHTVGALGLSGHVLFTGALWDEERDRMYRAADLLVMPSVSEPFGLVPLEAMKQGTPVLISKQSGVAEVLTHALKVDFWDVDEMANKIIAALRYPVMRHQLIREGRFELFRISWRRAAEKVVALYRRLLGLFGGKG